MMTTITPVTFLAQEIQSEKVSIPFTSPLRYKARKHRQIRRSRRVEAYPKPELHPWKPIGSCGCRREVETQPGDYRPERVRRQYRSHLFFLSGGEWIQLQRLVGRPPEPPR